MDADDSIRVEVAYARPERQLILEVDLSIDATIADAIRLSGIKEHFPEIDLNVNKVGIFGKLARLDGRLRDGDRVEIYRKLIADPKEARRQRAAGESAERKAGPRVR